MKWKVEEGICQCPVLKLIYSIFFYLLLPFLSCFGVFRLFLSQNMDSSFEAFLPWHYKCATVYKWLTPSTPEITFKAPLSCEHAVPATLWNSLWHEASTLALHTKWCVCDYGNFFLSERRSLCVSLSGRCKWCKFLSCSTPMLFWCVGNSFARPITPSHQHYSFMLPALFSFLGGESPWDTLCAS